MKKGHLAFVLDEKKAKAFFDACDKVDEQGRTNFDRLMERYDRALKTRTEKQNNCPCENAGYDGYCYNGKDCKKCENK